jgi:Met-zincin/Domain of unknown function (DUF5117)/Domain of unknown function (DUF5118)
MNQSFRLSALTTSLLMLGACSTLSIAPPTATPSATAATTTSPVATSAPSAARPTTPPAAGAPGTPPLRPYAEVIKDAKEFKGMLTVYQKDDKAWLALNPEQFEQPMIFQATLTHGIGEKNIYGNTMLDNEQIIAFRQFNPTTVQVIALNAAYGPRDKSPAGLIVERMFSDSLLFNAPIVSLPDSKSKAVLIELNGLVLNDYPQGGAALERAYRQAYAYDPRNSSITKVRSTDDQLSINTRAHYATARIAVPTPGTPPGMPVPSVPSTVPDARSLFLGFNYSFASLPKEPMPGRVADERVGHFLTNVYDYSDHTLRTPRVRYVNRWRLEKKDPNAALSEPKQPIVFWLDKNIPTKYREATTKGLLMWNAAYEKIGFKDAIVVKQQGVDDDFDTSDIRHASIRWIIGKDVPFGARGPSMTDPRSGEILDADIEMSEDISRIYTSRYGEDTPRPIGMFKSGGMLCTHAEGKFSEMAFALDLLAARGEFDIGSEKAEAFVLEGLIDIVGHEVGHTLGLRHNFRASTIYTAAQLADIEHTKTKGVSGSIMDYNALNIGLGNEKQANYFMQGIGPYDHWAIEYAYRPLPRETENTELGKIASRSNEPELAYATDEDAGYGAMFEGIDPAVNRSDMTNDPLAFYAKRVAIIQEMWNKLQARTFAPGESQEMLRRNVDRGIGQLGVVTNLAAKYVGGLSVLRDRAGSGRTPLTPIAAGEQKRALKLLTDALFSVDSLQFKPEFVSRLVLDPFATRDALFADRGMPSIDFSISNRLLSLQRAALAQITTDSVAQRLIDTPDKLNNPAEALTLNELYTTLNNAIWSELDNGRDISTARRNLQRELLKGQVGALTRASGSTPAEARSLQRLHSKQLLAKIEAALKKPNLSVPVRAHLDEARDQLEAGLKATYVKAGV